MFPSQRDRARSEPVFAPANFSGLQFHATQILAVLLPAIESEQEPVTVHAASVMIGQDIVPAPDFFDAAAFDTKEHGAGLITRREKNLIVNDQRCGRIDRSVHPRPPGKLEPDSSVVWIKGGQPGPSEEQSVAQPMDGGRDRR